MRARLYFLSYRSEGSDKVTVMMHSSERKPSPRSVLNPNNSAFSICIVVMTGKLTHYSSRKVSVPLPLFQMARHHFDYVHCFSG